MSLKSIINFIMGIIVCFMCAIVFLIEILLDAGFNVNLMWGISVDNKIYKREEYILKQLDDFKKDQQTLDDIILYNEGA